MSMIAITQDTDATDADAPAASVSAEALRYLIASVVALAVDAALLWVGAKLVGLPIWLAGALSYFAGMVLIYVLSIRWVFAKRIVSNQRSEFALFATLGLIGLVLNSATLSIATGLGLALPFAKLLSAGIGFVTNFVSRKLLLFTARPT